MGIHRCADTLSVLDYEIYLSKSLRSGTLKSYLDTTQLSLSDNLLANHTDMHSRLLFLHGILHYSISVNAAVMLVRNRHLLQTLHSLSTVNAYATSIRYIFTMRSRKRMEAVRLR